MARIINKFGEIAGWNSIDVEMLGRVVDGITEVEYDDDQKMENKPGRGGYPVGQGKGNYNATASITLLLEEVRGIEKALPAGKRLQDIAPFAIKVNYEVNGDIITDVIKNCRFMKRGVAAKNDDTALEYKYELLTSHIEWNVR